MLIDQNPRTKEIAAAGGTLYQRHVDGKLWKWDGHTACTATACPGWMLIDQNPRTQSPSGRFFWPNRSATMPALPVPVVAVPFVMLVRSTMQLRVRLYAQLDDQATRL
jgi:hypothetical protein